MGEWRLLSLLGSGGMSNVYLAQHRVKSDSYCAIKITKDYITRKENVSEDPCYESTVAEWKTYLAINKSLPADKFPAKQIPADWGLKTEAKKPQNQARKVSAGSLQAKKVGSGSGLLPAAYEYGFVSVGKQKRFHGWIALQLLGVNLHACATDRESLLIWATFYRVNLSYSRSTNVLMQSL